MSELTRVPLTAAEVGALTRMQPYEDGKGGWQFRDPTTAERADVVERIIATRMAAAWDEGYMRGQNPWVTSDPDEADPVQANTSPPTWGRNANPYRAAPSHPTATEVDQ